MIEKMAQAFAAGEVKSFMVVAERFELLDVPYTCDVLLLDRNGAQLSAMTAAETSYFLQPRNGPFYEVRISSQLAQTIKWVWGSGDAGTRKTAGVVQVVDGGKARTVADQAFAYASGATGAAGQFAGYQLFNPVGSGRRLIVKAYAISALAATTVSVFAGATQYANLLPALPNGKHPGGALPVATARSAALAANTAGTATVDYYNFTQQGSAPRVVLQEPIVLEPGNGLSIEAGQPNVQINASLEWTEESV